MSKFRRLVKARSTWQCWECSRLIMPGTLHFIHSLPPGAEFGSYDRWTHGRWCRSCCENYGWARDLWAAA